VTTDASSTSAKAAVLTGVDAEFEIWDVELPALRPGQVTVRMAASGICHSDHSVRAGKLGPQQFPTILGHEGSGVIEAVGEGVTKVAPGDHVVISFKPFCGSCWYCRRGEGYLCDLAMEATPMIADGKTVHKPMPGTFAERTVLSDTSVVKIDEEIALADAALLGCGVMTGFGAATNTATIGEGDSVVVIGCGGVGLSAIQGAAYAGAGEIIAIDRVVSKLDLAKRFGATVTINSTDGSPVSAVRDLTEGRGVDHAFEVVGRPDTIDLAVEMTRPGGETVLVGLPSLDVMLNVHAVALITQNRRLQGSMYGSCDFARDVVKLLDLYSQNALRLGDLISHRIPLESIQQGFDALDTGEATRTVIVY
jgi:S-(hydroxymethyl)glutathione dehydrogenase / alcohol dehydrogenase